MSGMHLAHVMLRLPDKELVLQHWGKIASGARLDVVRIVFTQNASSRPTPRKDLLPLGSAMIDWRKRKVTVDGRPATPVELALIAEPIREHIQQQVARMHPSPPPPSPLASKTLRLAPERSDHPYARGYTPEWAKALP